MALHSLQPFSWRGRLVLLFAALLTSGSGRGAAAAAEKGCLEGAGRVENAQAEDARAVRLADGRVVRLAGLETFALLSVEEAGAEAALRHRIEALVAGKVLLMRILSDKPDRYGRLPALLAAADGPLVQTVLAREGLAVAFAMGEALPCFATILAAEDEARRSRAGFWAQAKVLSATPDSLAPRFGRFALFEGVVLSVGNRPSRTYLNFGQRWSQDVTVAIAKKDRPMFGGEAALADLAGKRVRVRGFVEDRAGPLVSASSPMQIEVIGGASATTRNRP